MVERGREFPPIGALVGGAQFPSPNPNRASDSTVRPIVNANQIVAGILRAGGIEATAIDVPGPGQTGFHVDQSGNVAIGATQTDPQIAALVQDLAVFVKRNTGSGQAFKASTKDDSDYLWFVSASGTQFWAPSPGGTADVRLARDAANVLTIGAGTVGGVAGELQEMSAPSTPAANKLRYYAKDDAGTSGLYAKDDAGTEHELTNRAPKLHDHTGAGDGGVLTKDEHDDYMQFNSEIADPAAPAADRARFYIKDNGAGKTQLAVRFATGAVQIVATEP